MVQSYNTYLWCLLLALALMSSCMCGDERVTTRIKGFSPHLKKKMGEEAEEDDFDIFEFSSSNKRQLAATLKPTTGGKNLVPPIGGRHLPLSSCHLHQTSDSSGDSDDDDDGRSRR